MSNPHQPRPPQLLPTTVTEGQAPGVGYRIEGELVPVLYGYLAFSAARYPQSVVEITGLTAPTF
jgi:hypothetical protein